MIHDFLATVGSFLLLLVVHALGMARERARKPAPPPRPNLHCGCGDELSMHDGLGGCRMINQQVSTKRANGSWGYERIQCSCQQYTGDLPVDWYARHGLPDTS